MSVAGNAASVQPRGTWPEPVRLRRGWARAEARRWNDATPDASLRILRGGASFVDACTEYLIGVGVPSVLSPPLPGSAARTWESVGYERFVRLALMRTDLDRPLPTPDHLVARGNVDVDLLLDIDRAAFDEFWRFDRLGLEEAISATSATTILTIAGANGSPVAYAVVGVGHAISYLQRLAVHPEWQGAGRGRSLVRSAFRAARAAGTRAMVLNTQHDNEPAIRLYEAEGFVLQPEPLAVLRRK
jgi:ribosomal protein S18 acetylase RimI-like enzyme